MYIIILFRLGYLIYWATFLSLVIATSVSQDVIRSAGDGGQFGVFKGKIAFLFLSKGALFHEELWALFFTWNAPRTHYSIYWHPSPAYVPAKSSFFASKAITNRVPTSWGNWSLVEAQRRLYQAALRDKMNEYFVLLSETCVPLVPFPVWYRSMMGYYYPYSIINACNNDAIESLYKNLIDRAMQNRSLYKDVSQTGTPVISSELLDEVDKDRLIRRRSNQWSINTRWTKELDGLQRFNRSHWRKSSQWSALNRKHASLVAYDSYLAPHFKDIFAADEHYVPSLLAMHNQDASTACSPDFAHIRWPNYPSSHPLSYTSEEIAEYNSMSPQHVQTEERKTSNKKCVPKPSQSMVSSLFYSAIFLLDRAPSISTSTGYDSFFNHLLSSGSCAYDSLIEKKKKMSSSSDTSSMYISSRDRTTNRRAYISAPKQARHSSEEVVCHFTARKFPHRTQYQLLYEAKGIFRDNLFDAFLSKAEIWKRSVIQRLRYDLELKSLYLIEGKRMFRINYGEYLGVFKEMFKSIRKLSPEEKRSYADGGILNHFGQSFDPNKRIYFRIEFDTETRYHKERHSKDELWLLYNGTRRRVYLNSKDKLSEALLLSTSINIVDIFNVAIEPPLTINS